MGFWEVQLAGSWKSLGRVVGTACNEAQSRGATQLKFVSHKQQYLLDFNTMTQTNVNSGKTRPIRKKSAHRHSDAIHVHPTPLAPPAPAAVAPAVPTPAAPAKMAARSASAAPRRWEQ